MMGELPQREEEAAEGTEAAQALRDVTQEIRKRAEEKVVDDEEQGAEKKGGGKEEQAGSAPPAGESGGGGAAAATLPSEALRWRSSTSRKCRITRRAWRMKVSVSA
jgi:hypothetical protein